MTDVLDRPTAEETTELTPATKPPKVKDLTQKEEEQLRYLFGMTEKGQRFLLLRAFEGKAHKAVKLGSFEDYCKEKLGLSHDASHLSRMVNAARVERAIMGESFDAQQLSIESGDVPKEKDRPKLSLRTAAKIAQLPEEEWKPIYEEHLAVKHDTLTPKERLEELGRVVDRRYRELNPDAPKPGRKAGATRVPPIEVASTPVTAVEPTAPKRDMTPVTGATYDGSDEQQAIENGYENDDDDQITDADVERFTGGTAEAPGATDNAPAPYYGVTPTEIEERLKMAESFIKAFVSACESEEGGEVSKAFQQLYNDCTQYEKTYGL